MSKDYVLDILSKMGDEVLVASTFECRHVLGILRVYLDWLQDLIPFNELMDIDFASVKFRNQSFQSTDNHVQELCLTKNLETATLDIFYDSGVDR